MPFHGTSQMALQMAREHPRSVDDDDPDWRLAREVALDDRRQLAHSTEDRFVLDQDAERVALGHDSRCKSRVGATNRLPTGRRVEQPSRNHRIRGAARRAFLARLR